MKFMFECDEMDGLVFDFPKEAWNTVRMRETKSIRAFCNSGKMIIWLLDGIEKECEIENSNKITDSPKWLHIPTGKLLAVMASELIQCLSCPELEMEKVFELEVESGWYAIWNEGEDKIVYCKKEPQNSVIQNIQEISGFSI